MAYTEESMAYVIIYKSYNACIYIYTYIINIIIINILFIYRENTDNYVENVLSKMKKSSEK